MSKAKQTRTYESNEITQVLKDQGATAQEFGEYLDKSPQVISYMFKQGIDKSLENNLKCFFAERKGITIKIDGIDFV